MTATSDVREVHNEPAFLGVRVSCGDAGSASRYLVLFSGVAGEVVVKPCQEMADTPLTCDP